MTYKNEIGFIYYPTLRIRMSMSMVDLYGGAFTVTTLYLIEVDIYL